MSNLKTKIKAGQFVITAEIVPPLSAAGLKLLHEAGQLKGKVDAINLTDAAAGKTSISSFAAAALLVADGHEPILQVTCRDRNRISLVRRPDRRRGARRREFADSARRRSQEWRPARREARVRLRVDRSAQGRTRYARQGRVAVGAQDRFAAEVLHRRGRRAETPRCEMVARAAAEKNRSRRRLHPNAIRLRPRRRARLHRAAAGPKASRTSSASSSASGRFARPNRRAG